MRMISDHLALCTFQFYHVILRHIFLGRHEISDLMTIPSFTIINKLLYQAIYYIIANKD